MVGSKTCTTAPSLHGERAASNQWGRTQCPYCGVGCGLLVQIQDGQAVRVKGDPEHPANFAEVCAKAIMLPRALKTPDRLLYPQVRPRRDRPLARVPWSMAWKTVTRAFRDIIAHDGPDAIAFYGSGKLLTGDKSFTNLPRKFNVTITGCRENCVHAETQDLALVPATQSSDGAEVKRFNVLVGGKLGSGGYRIASPLDVFIAPEEAAELCRAIILTFRDHGPREARNKARMAFLLEQWGTAKFRAEVERALGRSLPPGGIDARRDRSTDHVADIGLLGSKTKVDGKAVDAVSIFVGGRTGRGARLAEKIMEDVPCDRLPAVLEQLVQYYPRKSSS